MPSPRAPCVPPNCRKTARKDDGGAQGAPIQRAPHTPAATPNRNPWASQPQLMLPQPLMPPQPLLPPLPPPQPPMPPQMPPQPLTLPQMPLPLQLPPQLQMPLSLPLLPPQPLPQLPPLPQPRPRCQETQTTLLRTGPYAISHSRCNITSFIAPPRVAYPIRTVRSLRTAGKPICALQAAPFKHAEPGGPPTGGRHNMAHPGILFLDGSALRCYGSGVRKGVGCDVHGEVPRRPPVLGGRPSCGVSGVARTPFLRLAVRGQSEVRVRSAMTALGGG
jgi:hypothetical protein